MCTACSQASAVPMALVPLQRSIQLAPALKPWASFGSMKRWVPQDVSTWPWLSASMIRQLELLRMFS
ncbi:hypothetical protein D3C84_1212220 [compost metagenome]